MQFTQRSESINSYFIWVCTPQHLFEAVCGARWIGYEREDWEGIKSGLCSTTLRASLGFDYLWKKSHLWDFFTIKGGGCQTYVL